MRFCYLVIIISSAPYVFVQAQSWKTYPYHQEGSVINFPADEGSHPGEPTEWWYINGHLTGKTSGTDYSFMLSYFYQPQLTIDGARIFSIANETRRQFYSQTLYCNYQNLSQDYLNIEVNPISGVVEKWITVKDDLGNYKPFEYKISASNQNGTLDINCTALKRPLMVGESGFLKLGANSNSYYYSQTMLAVDGTILLDGFTEPIAGTAWIDHQYGELTSFVKEGYEWFNIQLSNGMDFNLWNIFKNQTQLPAISAYKLCTMYLNELQDTTVSDFELARLKYSFMPNSYNCYAQEWHFLWDKIDLIISTNQKEYEIFSPYIFYEGSTSIHGWVDSIPVTGVGFAELLHRYENPKIKFNGVDGKQHSNSLLISWELLNPDDGRPVHYDLELSKDNGAAYFPVAQKLTGGFFIWDTTGFGINANSILRITGYSIDSTLKGSDIIKIGDIKSSPEANYNFYLNQNYPNPFNSTTKIRFTVPTTPASLPLLNMEGTAGWFITLKVYDILGNEVATLVNEEKTSGVYTIDFDADNLPSGVYIYQLKSGEYLETKKMICLR